MLYSAIVLLVFSVALKIDAQIPGPCATYDSLTARKCCPTPDLNVKSPGECGENIGRGMCQDVILENNTLPDDDVRKNWPLGFFNRTCNCSEGFGGYDCGECGFGYVKNGDGSGCSKRTVLRKRTSLQTLTDDDWKEYHRVLNKTRHSPSRYMVVTEEPDNPTNVQALIDSMVNPTLYDLFVWIHHFVAKDSELTNANYKRDYAHEATGFPTWHRLFLLWLEKEIQELDDNPMFTLHYWDWTNPTERTAYFTKTRLGENVNGNVTFENNTSQNWDTTCWNEVTEEHKKMEKLSICNPTIPTDPLRRCPIATACESENTDWPTCDDVTNAVSIENYDVSPFNICVDENLSFRNYMEGFIPKRDQTCEDDKMCLDDCKEGNMPYAVKRKLHNSVHVILGIGDFKTNLKFFEKGVMADVAASPNDPIFINHHTMIDCILEKWLQDRKEKLKKGELKYPLPSGEIPNGHNANDSIVPFIPLYTHSEMFKTADDFGYECTLPETALCTTDPSPPPDTETPETDTPGIDTPGTEGPQNKATASTVDQISLLATLLSALMIGNL